MAPELQFHLTLLILLAALTHAAWNAIVKASGDHILTFAMLRAFGTGVGLIAVWFVPMPAPEAWPFLALSGAVHTAYYTLLMLAYRHGDLNLVYPIARGGAPMLVAGLAVLAAGEVPPPGKFFGIALVSAGILGLSFAKGWPRGADGKAVALAALTAVSVMGYTVVDGLGARASGDAIAYVVWLHLFEGPPFLVWALYMRHGRVLDHFAAHWRRGLAGGVFSFLAYGLVIYAMTQGAMAHVAALRETSVLFAALIGTFLLKESFGARRVMAAAVIVAGVVMLQLGR